MNTRNSPRCLLRLVAHGLFGWTLIALSASAAVVTNVMVVDFAFNPASVTVNVNDQVKWSWNCNFQHSTTDSFWDSGLHNGTTFTYTNQFPSAGNFPYECSLHHFIGSVTVQGAVNLPPTVTITNPPNGAVLSAPATVVIMAASSDSDGSVTNVQFLQGAATLTNRTSVPYSVTVSNLAPGGYGFSAVASDNAGAKATNAISVSVVTPVAIVLSNPKRVSGTNFQFNYSANVGLRYAIQRSADLSAWNPLGTNTAASNPVAFVHTNATASPGFYRVGRLPNP